MKRALAALAAVVALPLVSCSGGGGDDDAFLLTLEGRAEVEGRRLGDGEHRLDVGEVVRITSGTATLGLPGRRTLELRAGKRAGDDSRVEVASVPTLIDGHALLVAGEDEVARLRSGTATIAVREGAARVRRSTGVNLAVYEGTAEVEALGRERPVPALRQVGVADSGALPRRALPLVYDRADLDPWDRRYLGGAIALGGRLERASVALNRRLAPPPAPDPDYFRQLVPGLRARTAFGSALLEGRRSSVGETVVGASIVLGGPGPFAERWAAAFDFREDGADWGLVALDQRARRGAVFGVLDGILDAVAAALPAFVVAPVSTGGVPGGTPSRPPARPRPGAPDGGDEPEEPLVPVVPEPEAPLLPELPPGDLPLLPDDPDEEGADSVPTVPEPALPEPADGLLEPVTEPVTGVVNEVVETVDGLLGPLTGPLLG